MTNSTSSLTTQKETNKFWEFRNQANSQSAELLLYGDISQSSWWGDESHRSSLRMTLRALVM